MTGVVLPFAGATAPDGWLLCYGQSLLRADYPNLFAVLGTNHGAADGTHFNVPDLRGRVPAGKDNMGGVAASRLTTAGAAVDGATLGAAGGVQNVGLSMANLPAHAFLFHTNPGGGAASTYDFSGPDNGAFTLSGSSTAHTNTQPTIVLNHIIKL